MTKVECALANELRNYLEDGRRNVLSAENYDGLNLQNMFHGKIDWDVAKRFLYIIYLYGPIKKTRLAMKTGVNSSTCTRYTTWLMEIDWICMNRLDEFGLTEAGLVVFKRTKLYDI